MEITKTILLLVALSCLFSLSASRPGPSPASAPVQAFSPSEPEGSDNYDASFNILPEADPGLQKICGDTDHPIECVQTTAPLLEAENVSIEPLSILEVELQALGNKTKEALAKAVKILMDPTIEEAMISRIETCVDSYGAILESNQKILDAIQLRDTYVLNMELSSNVENLRGCSDEFDEADVESPLKEIDELIGKMISNSLAIGVDLVHF